MEIEAGAAGDTGFGTDRAAELDAGAGSAARSIGTTATVAAAGWSGTLAGMDGAGRTDADAFRTFTRTPVVVDDSPERVDRGTSARVTCTATDEGLSPPESGRPAARMSTVAVEDPADVPTRGIRVP
jgi:hypothetical protein